MGCKHKALSTNFYNSPAYDEAKKAGSCQKVPLCVSQYKWLL